MLTQLRSPDGSGKRRRRRSEQPIVTARRRRRIWITVVLGLITLILAGYFGFRFFQRLRLEGETFREGLDRRLSDAIGCQVALTRIRDGGQESLSATEARIRTRDQDLIESGIFSGINASLTSSSWVSEDWGVMMLSISTGTIRFNPNRPLIEGNTTGWIPRTGGRERGTGGFRFGITSEPDKISLDAMRFTGGLDLEWPVPGKEGAVEAIRRLKGGSIKFLPGGLIEGRFINGTIELESLPAMTLDPVNWHLDGRKLKIDGGSIYLGGRDCADVAGEASLVTEGSVELAVTFNDTPLNLLLPPVWSDRVSGKLETTESTFRATFANGPDRSFEGRFSVTGCVLKGFGFMNKLAFALQNPELTNAEFPTLAGRFSWSPSRGLELSELTGDLNGVLRLNGSVSITPAKVSGQLKVSVSEVALGARSGNAAPLFGPVTDGWASLDFSLSGTVAAIDDSIVLPGDSENTVRPPVSPANPPGEVPRTKDTLEKEFNDLLPK